MFARKAELFFQDKDSTLSAYRTFGILISSGPAPKSVQRLCFSAKLQFGNPDASMDMSKIATLFERGKSIENDIRKNE
jgi:hypothetical protein